jgi:hypothetical protein
MPQPVPTCRQTHRATGDRDECRHVNAADRLELVEAVLDERLAEFVWDDYAHYVVHGERLADKRDARRGTDTRRSARTLKSSDQATTRETSDAV